MPMEWQKHLRKYLQTSMFRVLSRNVFHLVSLLVFATPTIVWVFGGLFFSHRLLIHVKLLKYLFQTLKRFLR